MKIRKTLIGIFLSTFVVGCGLVFLTISQPVEQVNSEEVIPAQIPSPPVPIVSRDNESIDEAFDWKEEDDSRFKIKLLETGDGFHGDQVNARNGEKWLGLFREKDKYYLRSTKLKIRLVHDDIVDGANPRVKTGKSVATDLTFPAVFLLKNAKFLSEGEIKTIYFATDSDDSSELKNRTQKTFEFNGEKYHLRVENKVSDDEYLGKGSKLVLSHDGKGQVLSYLKEGCNDCFWYLYWVGDLDRDGKLDFYFDLSWHYNVTDRKLFLSSQAEKGKIVKYIANFWTNGC